MVQSPFELWLNNKNEAIKKFSEELQNVDAPAYLEIPLNIKEWEAETNPIRKMAT